MPAVRGGGWQGERGWEKEKRKREKSWKETEEGKNEMCDGTVAPAESCANSETSPLPSPSSCQVVPQPLGRAQLSKKRGRGVDGEAFVSKKKIPHQKIACPKWPEFPLIMAFKIAKNGGRQDGIPTCLLWREVGGNEKEDGERKNEKRKKLERKRRGKE